MSNVPTFESNLIITIGIPTFNRLWSLPRVLEAIAQFDYPKEKIRIIFADNCSRDGTLQILEDFRRRWGGEYESVYIFSQRTNIPEARNLCVANSLGHYILFIDSDTTPPPNAISHILKLFDRSSKVAIVGLPYPYESQIQDEGRRSRDIRSEPHSALVISFGCTMIRRALFDQIGLFNPEWDRGEDYELTSRARSAGYLALLEPRLTAIHLEEESTHETAQDTLSDFSYLVGDLSEQISRHLVRFRRSVSDRSRFGSTYPANAVVFPAAILLVFWKVILTLTLLPFYIATKALRLPRKTGGWRTINALFFPLYGLPFAAGVMREIVVGEL